MRGIPARTAIAVLGLALGATTVLAQDVPTPVPTEATQQAAHQATSESGTEAKKQADTKPTAAKPTAKKQAATKQTATKETATKQAATKSPVAPKPAQPAATATASAPAPAKTKKVAAAETVKKQDEKTGKKQDEKAATKASLPVEADKKTKQAAPAATDAKAEKSQPTTAAVVKSAEAVALAPHGFTYNSGGRRDPFVTLLKKGTDAAASTVAARAAGLAGLSSSEVTLRGILASQGSFVAMLLGADEKTYIVHPGDKLSDGTIETITANAMIIQQRTTDALSKQKSPREIRKVLRRTEGTN